MKKMQAVYLWCDGWRVHHTTSSEVYRLLYRHGYLLRGPHQLPNNVLRFFEEQGVEISIGDWKVNFVTNWQLNAMDQIQQIKAQLQCLENLILDKQNLTLM